MELARVWLTQGQHAYWLFFVVGFFAVSLWESFAPLTANSLSTGKRWGGHAMLFAASAIIQTAIIRLLPVGAAGLVQNSPIGLLNRPEIPEPAKYILTILSLDLLQYWIHRAFHSNLWFWRIHEIHHSDPDYNVSTAVRFHPLEVLPPQAIRLAAVLLLAPPPLAVLLDQFISMILNFTSHANATYPARVESAVRLLFITPDLHRIHHSQHPADQGTNFGQIFSFWDRLFGTYRAHANSSKLVTGVNDAEFVDRMGVGTLLLRPFHRRK